MPPSLQREAHLTAAGHAHVIGIDEAGRGPLAGPVVAAAVELHPKAKLPNLDRLDDSKKLTAELRHLLCEELICAVRYGIGIVHAEKIDAINIRQASWLAMREAAADLVRRCHDSGEHAYVVSYVLIDGLPYGKGPWPYDAIVRGDAECLSIAAASIIAKVTRDRAMIEYDLTYPQYGFKSHKGYGCPQHLAALHEHGPCPLHRRSFAPVRAAVERQYLLFGDAKELDVELDGKQ